LGKDRSTIANALRLLKLPPSVKSLVAEGKLSPGHARALLSSNSSASEMSKTAAHIVEKDWSVRETERWAKRTAQSPRPQKSQDPNEAAAEDRLRISLGAKVEIHTKSNESGEIRIFYFNQEELMRLYTMLTEKAIARETNHAI
jgi:ParB family transcriptional regulator, chromosome partitioning protein